MVSIKQEEASEDSAGTPELGAQDDSPVPNLNPTSLTSAADPVKLEPYLSTAEGELSEISDSDDDILNKTDKVLRPKSELTVDMGQEMDPNNAAQEAKITETSVNGIVASNPIKVEEVIDEVLDFEEISDGELEEDARNKGEDIKNSRQ